MDEYDDDHCREKDPNDTRALENADLDPEYHLIDDEIPKIAKNLL